MTDSGAFPMGSSSLDDMSAIDQLKTFSFDDVSGGSC
jgi:hypothetical protein